MAVRVVHLPVGSLGVDKTGAAISASAAATLFGLGYRFALREIGLPNVSTSQGGQLSEAEAAGILGAGLALGVFQVNFLQPCITSDQGVADARYLCERVDALGLSSTADSPVVLWFDLEGAMAGASAPALTGYVEGWGATVVGAGFAAGMYTGAGSQLSGSTISDLADFHAYWQAGQRLDYPMPARGHQLLQLHPGSLDIGGTLVDVDVVQEDFGSSDSPGSTPSFWGSAP